MRFHVFQYALGFPQVPAFQPDAALILFSAYLNELVRAQQNLRVLLETGDSPSFFSQEAESDSSFFFCRRPSIEDGVGARDLGLLFFFFLLDSLCKRLGSSDHEGTVEHEQILLRHGARDPPGGRARGRWEIKEPEKRIGFETVPVPADGRIESSEHDVEDLVRGLPPDLSVKLPGDGQQAVAPDLDLHSSGAHSPQQAVVSILIEVLLVEAAASLVGGG